MNFYRKSAGVSTGCSEISTGCSEKRILEHGWREKDDGMSMGVKYGCEEV